MDAKTYPLQDILKPERRYIIPTFQRDYEWTLDGQWKLLFEDLENVSDRLLELRESGLEGSALTSREQNLSPHFLGAIVCARLPFSPGGVALRSVIDGQQRLTTVQLLIRGVLDVLIEVQSDRIKAVRRMLFNPDDVVESPEEVFKLWPRRRDRDVWETALTDVGAEIITDDSHLYLSARKFFADSARTYAYDDEGAMSTPRLLALVDALSSLFKLVVIDLDDNDDAQVIFEVLNGRQTALSATDLVKNLLFLRSELADEDVEVLYDRYWSQFDDPWWKKEVGRGHAQRGRRDVLLSVWLTIATGNEANVGHLYREARDYLNDGPETESVLQDLDSVATAYRAIYDDEAMGEPELSLSYRRIRALDITTAVPLLAWLRTLPETTIDRLDHVTAVRAVESWALRRAFVGWQTRGYGTHLTRVLRESQFAASKEVSVIDAVITGLQGGVLDWPTDADVDEAFVGKRFYGAISAARLRLLLGSIDAQLRSENPNEPTAIINYDDLQIEHVMPQSWTEHWPLPDDDDPAGEPSTQAAERSRAIDRVGNLTLVTPTFNRGVSNLAWSVKRKEFKNQRSLVLNYEIEQSETWDETSILDRAKELSAAACRVWPSAVSLGRED